MPVKLGDHQPGSPEWHELRAGRLGGSDAGTLIGHGFHDWQELLNLKAGRTEPTPDTPAMARGRWLEPACALYLADKKGLSYDRTFDGTWASDDEPRFIYNPDAVTTDGRLCEFKTTHMRLPDKWGRGGTDQVPPAYLSQCQWGMHILGLDECLLAVIATKPTRDGSDFDFANYRIKYDRKFADYLMRRGARFLGELDSMVPPIDVSHPAGNHEGEGN